MRKRTEGRSVNGLKRRGEGIGWVVFSWCWVQREGKGRMLRFDIERNKTGGDKTGSEKCEVADVPQGSRVCVRPVSCPVLSVAAEVCSSSLRPTSSRQINEWALGGFVLIRRVRRQQQLSGCFDAARIGTWGLGT